MFGVRMTRSWCACGILVVGGLWGCEGVSLDAGDISDIIDIIENGNDNAGGNANDNGPSPEPVVFNNVELTPFATNTDGAGGMAFNPVDGGLYVVNRNGLFGPIQEGDDLSTKTAIGATNLADADLFDAPTDSLVLAITETGEFWIGSSCCITLAVVPAGGGDAEPFEGLLQGSTPANIFPETMVIAPANVNLPGVSAGNLLVSEETTFSKLAAIDVAGDRSVTLVDNSSGSNRQGHHIAFGPDGTLYTSRGVPGATILGIQTVASDGAPTGLSGTLNLAADSFVVLDNGDLVLRGAFTTDAGQQVEGIHLYSAADESVTPGVEIPQEEASEDDEMLIAPDGRILLSLPARDEIVVVTDVRE